jgi:hypothetical protein
VSYLNETRYHWFSLDSEQDLSAVDLDLSLDQLTWVTADHTTEPLLADFPPPDAGFTRYWWKALFGPAESLTLTVPEQTVYGRITPSVETLRPTWIIRSALPASVFPCDWPVDYCSDNLPSPLDGIDGSKVQRYERMAIDYLWNWTGQKYGTCTVALRPCRQPCADDRSTFGGPRAPFTPALIGGQWYNLACGSCGEQCGCGFTPTIVLPDLVAEVQEVLIDGAVLSPTAYRLDNGRYLTRLDGGRWPTCQDLTAPTTAAGTWEITYTVGLAVPTGGQIAAGVLAAEFAKAACNDESCQLPQRVQRLSRQGVDIVFDQFDDIEKGHTGIWLIDGWIASVTKPPRRSRVYSPDVSRRAPVRPVS